MSIAPWPQQYDRAWVRGAIEEASGQALSVDDPLPDSLIATAEALGMIPAELRVWIADVRTDWSLDALRRWAARHDIGGLG
jgi:hypothetical protein